MYQCCTSVLPSALTDAKLSISGNDRSAVTPAEAAQSAKSSNDFMRMFKEFKTTIAPDAKTTPHALPTSEEECMLKVSLSDCALAAPCLCFAKVMCPT